MRKQSLRILIFAVIMGTTIDAGAQSFRDASLPVDDRVADLLGRMTLGEKAAQLQCLWDSKPTVLDETGAFLSDKASELLPDGIGCLARPSDYLGL
ncbi:MAG: beta-glucosidase, partial [Rhodothermales bacterium]|nr:beta-glucosidase [Rhodothermales bacterium]